MWISDKWSDYELLDCGGGEKLERWGNYTLVRPDPQAIWSTPRRHPGWRKADARYARSQPRAGSGLCAGAGRWPTAANGPQHQAHEFQAHRPLPRAGGQLDFAESQIRRAGRPVSVLNLFAYAGGATVACAAAGASVCHVDAAKGMVSWASRMRSSGLEEAPIRWIIDDCGKFVERRDPPGPQV